MTLIASGSAALAGCQPGWDTFFNSLQFRTAAEAAAAVPSGGSQQFGNLNFVPPAGWSVQPLRGALYLSASGVRDPERLEVFLLPGHLATSLEAEAASAWEEVRALLGAESMHNVSGRSYDLGGPGRSLAGVEYLTSNGGMRVGGPQWDVTIYALRAGERIERVAVLGTAFDENLVRYSTATNPRLSRQIRQLVFHMTFANQAPRAPMRTGLTPGGIVGVWAGLGMSFGGIKPQLAAFFDNGLAYFGPSLPLEGLDGIDPVVEQPTHPRDWGTYTWTGGAGVLTMPYGDIPLRGAGADLELTTTRTPHRYIKLAMPASGHLDGTWCSDGASCLRLTPDGRFDDRGAVRNTERALYAWPQAPAGGVGRYTLRDHTLQLAYEGGPVVRLAFPGLEDASNRSPSGLWLGWNLDRLEKR